MILNGTNKMTREEAINNLESLYNEVYNEDSDGYIYAEAIDMAIEVLQTDIMRCENCKYQDECEEVVLFEVTDDEVIGHRVHWCSYGRSK